MLDRHPVQIPQTLLITVLAAVAVRPAPAQVNQNAYEIAFVSDAGLHVNRRDGSSQRLLANEAGGLTILSIRSWSPDGTRIVLMRFGPNDAEMLQRYDIPFHFPLYLINTDGSGYERLVDVPALPWAEWSPDSRQLVFVSGYEDPRVGEPRVRANLESVSHAVYVLDLESRRTTRVTPVGRHTMFPSWSPDGSRLVFTVLTEDSGPRGSDIYVVNADGSGEQRLTATGNSLQAAWAPQGNLIALVTRATEADTQGGVFVMRPDGSSVRRVASGPANFVAWSPDGSKLLINSRSVRLLDRATGTQSDLGEGLLDATFAPDGQGVLFRTGGSIYFVDLQGQNRTLLAAGSSFAVSPRFPGRR